MKSLPEMVVKYSNDLKVGDEILLENTYYKINNIHKNVDDVAFFLEDLDAGYSRNLRIITLPNDQEVLTFK